MIKFTEYDKAYHHKPMAYPKIVREATILIVEFTCYSLKVMESSALLSGKSAPRKLPIALDLPILSA